MKKTSYLNQSLLIFVAITIVLHSVSITALTLVERKDYYDRFKRGAKCLVTGKRCSEKDKKAVVIGGAALLTAVVAMLGVTQRGRMASFFVKSAAPQKNPEQEMAEKPLEEGNRKKEEEKKEERPVKQKEEAHIAPQSSIQKELQQKQKERQQKKDERQLVDAVRARNVQKVAELAKGRQIGNIEVYDEAGVVKPSLAALALETVLTGKTKTERDASLNVLRELMRGSPDAPSLLKEVREKLQEESSTSENFKTGIAKEYPSLKEILPLIDAVIQKERLSLEEENDIKEEVKSVPPAHLQQPVILAANQHHPMIKAIDEGDVEKVATLAHNLENLQITYWDESVLRLAMSQAYVTLSSPNHMEIVKVLLAAKAPEYGLTAGEWITEMKKDLGKESSRNIAKYPTFYSAKFKALKEMEGLWKTAQSADTLAFL